MESDYDNPDKKLYLMPINSDNTINATRENNSSRFHKDKHIRRAIEENKITVRTQIEAINLLPTVKNLYLSGEIIKARLYLQQMVNFRCQSALHILLLSDLDLDQRTFSECVAAALDYLNIGKSADISHLIDKEFWKSLFRLAIQKKQFSPINKKHLPDHLQTLSLQNLIRLLVNNRNHLHVHGEMISALHELLMDDTIPPPAA